MTKEDERISKLAEPISDTELAQLEKQLHTLGDTTDVYEALSHASPRIVRQLVNWLVTYGYLPTPQRTLSAPTELTDLERADGARRWAEVNKIMGSVVFTDDEIRKRWYGLEPLTLSQKTVVTSSVPEDMNELLKTLEIAIEAGDSDTINRIMGLPVQKTLTAPDEGAPNVVVNVPTPKRIKKTFTYGEVDGKIRPTGVIEEELS